jgi:hypothetical protein
MQNIFITIMIHHMRNNIQAELGIQLFCVRYMEMCVHEHGIPIAWCEDYIL